MKIVNGKLEYSTGEPVLRSCPKCNPAHEHLMDADFLHLCTWCYREWIFGKFLDEFETDEQAENWIKEQINAKH